MGKPNSLIDYRDTEEQITFTVKRPSLRYLNEFLALKCAPDLLSWGVYPNVKEITESFAAFAAVRKYLGEKRLGDHAVRVLCVGDGNTPRTAACFAARSAWCAFSVDPRLKDATPWSQRIRRLFVIQRKIELVDLPKLPGDTVVVVAVHSHAELGQCAKFDPDLVVAIPCCVPQRYQGREPDHEYTDWGILSPERTMKVWKKHQEGVN